MNGPDDLPEQVPRTRLPQPPPGPHVGVEVSVAGREHQVDVFMSHHHLLQGQRWGVWGRNVSSYLYWVDVGMTVHSVVRRQETLTRSFATDHLEMISDVTLQFRSIYRFTRDISCTNQLLSLSRSGSTDRSRISERSRSISIRIENSI